MSPASVASFKALYAALYGVVLTDEEAERRAQRLVELYKVVYTADNIPGDVRPEMLDPTMHSDETEPKT